MKDEDEIMRQAIRDRDTFHDSSRFWKAVSIALFLLLLWTVLELRGCIAAHPNGWGIS